MFNSIPTIKYLQEAFDDIASIATEKDKVISEALGLLIDRVDSKSLINTRDIVSSWRANPSANLPYHNNFHQASVTVVANTLFNKCIFGEADSTIDRASLITAAMFHDYAHSGGNSKDTLNIVGAISWMAPRCHEKTAPLVYEAILSTEFPFIREPVSLVAKILRDADLLACVVCSPATYYEQYVLGLKHEIETSMKKVLTNLEFFSMQVEFLSKVSFYVASDLAPEMVEKFNTVIEWNKRWLEEETTAALKNSDKEA